MSRRYLKHHLNIDVDFHRGSDLEGGREKEEKEGEEGDFEMPHLHCFHVGTFF